MILFTHGVMNVWCDECLCDACLTIYVESLIICELRMIYMLANIYIKQTIIIIQKSMNGPFKSRSRDQLLFITNLAIIGWDQWLLLLGRLTLENNNFLLLYLFRTVDPISIYLLWLRLIDLRLAIIGGFALVALIQLFSCICHWDCQYYCQ